jgi:predicted nucleic acid-binding Zn ribbon protein
MKDLSYSHLTTSERSQLFLLQQEWKRREHRKQVIWFAIGILLLIIGSIVW